MVTFLTNEDRAELEGQISPLSADKTVRDEEKEAATDFYADGIVGGYYNTGSGLWVDASGFTSTRHVRCEGAKRIIIKSDVMDAGTDVSTGLLIHIAYYDKDKNWIGYQSNVKVSGNTDKNTYSGSFVIGFSDAVYFTTFATSGIFDKLHGVVVKEVLGDVPTSSLRLDAPIPAEWIEGKELIAREVMYTSDSPLFTETAYINTSGELASHANYRATDYIAAIPGTSIEYAKLQSINKYSYVVAFYDANKTFLKTSSIIGVTTEVSAGAGVILSGNVVVPDAARYFRISTVSLLNGTVEWSVETGAASEAPQWFGKKWFAFGTSITDTSYVNAETNEVTGKFVPHLANLGRLNVTDCGVAGGTMGSGGTHGGTSTILARILATDVSSADLITIEGCVNDFACAVPIGELGDTENTTICGAYYQAIKYCLENSNATVVLLTESVGREYTLTTTGNTADYRTTKKNSINKFQNDYNNAIREIGKFMGVHVIDAGGESQINEMHPEYLIDHIHHSELGGKQYAETIWEHLKNIHCNADLSQTDK